MEQYEGQAAVNIRAIRLTQTNLESVRSFILKHFDGKILPVPDEDDKPRGLHFYSEGDTVQIYCSVGSWAVIIDGLYLDAWPHKLFEKRVLRKDREKENP